ncbi:hypothetical protein [Saccharothrix sp. HUAS TT1]|uniref:hypothetical protein n=1 Tax=unclassified Saccharothrix TaxID=2593673 RepID=UPI00345BCB2F
MGEQESADQPVLDDEVLSGVADSLLKAAERVRQASYSARRDSKIYDFNAAYARDDIASALNFVDQALPKLLEQSDAAKRETRR